VELGRHLRELFRLRMAAIVCIMLGILAAVWVSYQIQLSPPAISPRSIEIASASTEVLVDTPFSAAVDLRQGRGSFEAMTSRATLLGNVIASPPVLEHIARRAHVPVEAIRAQPPLTPDFPRPIAQPGQEPAAKDILRLPQEYRINVQVDPSVPVLRVVSQAPTAAQAVTLANASIEGLEDFLDAVAAREATPPQDRIRLVRLGHSRGVVINGGVRLQASILAFLIVFGLSAAATIFLGRMRGGWREAEQQPAGDRPAPDGQFASFERAPADVR
jgi:hypothetical protein